MAPGMEMSVGPPLWSRLNISTTTERIEMKFCTDICVLQRKKPTDFGDLTFPLAPSSSAVVGANTLNYDALAFSLSVESYLV